MKKEFCCKSVCALRLPILAGMAQFAVVAAASAQSAIEPYVEYAKLVRATEQTAPLDDDLMGDSVSLFDGQTSFRNVDIQLKGNDALPVELARRLAVKPRPLGDFSKEYAGLGNWEIDVPSISGTFDAAYKWNTDVLNRPKARCSAVFYPTVRSGVNRREVWHGNSVHVPGRGDQEMLLLDGSPLAPTNGRAHLWTTSAMDAFECKGSTANGYPGEGFVMTTAAGTKYTFDVAVERGGSVIEKNQVRVPRTTVYLLASRIEDRLGNHVTYRYNGNGHPVSIASSDGRSISLDYDGERLVRASANGRVWSYHYDGNGQLATVVRPDQSRWQYQYGGSRVIVYEAWDAAIPQLRRPGGRQRAVLDHGDASVLRGGDIFVRPSAPLSKRRSLEQLPAPPGGPRGNHQSPVAARQFPRSLQPRNQDDQRTGAAASDDLEVWLRAEALSVVGHQSAYGWTMPRRHLPSVQDRLGVAAWRALPNL
ncbi:hypothetical protein ACFQGW_09915 [Xanthomonas theicola]|uniref:hypothetical protein n=1 Tax=Xanthomonas theicola TaxID=56464 RepID=UPI0036066C3F